MRLIYGLLAGSLFGLVLTKGGVVALANIRDMFWFRSPDLYLIIGSAVVVGALSILLIKGLRLKPVGGGPIEYKPKPWQKGIVFGGFLFGAGWYLTGTCPGPIFAQIGAGTWPALATLAGALIGTYLYGRFRGKLPH